MPLDPLLLLTCVLANCTQADATRQERPKLKRLGPQKKFLDSTGVVDKLKRRLLISCVHHLIVIGIISSVGVIPASLVPCGAREKRLYTVMESLLLGWTVLFLGVECVSDKRRISVGPASSTIGFTFTKFWE